MKNTFRYRLSQEDFIFFEQFAFKKFQVPRFLMSMPLIFIFVIYDGAVTKSFTIILGAVIALAIVAFGFFIYYKVGIKRKTERYIKKEPLYLSENEITIDSSAIESKTISKEGETAITTIYPYSIVNIIYETDEYFCFQIGSEAKILPKDKIPEAIRADVLETIRKSGKCSAVK